MSSNARVLVINSDSAEAEALTRKLHAQGYENVPHRDKVDALDQVRAARPDVVIIASNDGTGASLNLTRALKGRSDTAGVPVILITPPSSESARAEGLRAGADACLPFPYHDLQLFGRIESLARLGTMQEELRRRTKTAEKYGLQTGVNISPVSTVRDDANFLLVGEAREHFEQMELALSSMGTLTHAQSPATGMIYLERRHYDAILLNIRRGQETDFFQFIADIRRNSRLFNIPVVCLMDASAACDAAAPYAAGAADVFQHPINIGDFSARVDVLVRQQRYRDSLITTYRQSRDVSVCDSLTGLYSHGFMMEHLCELVADSHALKRNLAVGVFTFDNLTDINNLYGYSVGDKILRQVGIVVNNLVRGEDLSARYSGRRIVLVMPETRLVPGELVAHRIGSIINFTEIMEGDITTPIRAHVSTGIACLTPSMNAEGLITAAMSNSR